MSDNADENSADENSADENSADENSADENRPVASPELADRYYSREVKTMDLRLATTEDIVNELLQRELRFAFVCIEDTNSRRDAAACFAGKGDNRWDVVRLLHAGQETLERLNEDGGDVCAD